jgi:hypothetical protein
MTFTRASTAPLVAVLALTAVSVRGAEPTRDLWLDVVLASNQGATDPALAHMKQKFSQKGISYQSYRRLSSEQVVLAKGKSAQQRLPNGKTATVWLQDVKGHRAFLRVAVPPVDSTYELGRDGSIFMMVGQQGEGALILVISPQPMG